MPNQCINSDAPRPLSLSDQKLKFRNWSLDGEKALLTKRHENGNGKWIKDAYHFDWSTKETVYVYDEQFKLADSYMISDFKIGQQKYWPKKLGAHIEKTYRMYSKDL